MATSLLETRPAGRVSSHADMLPPEQRITFDDLLGELLEARATYEDLRNAGASPGARIDARERLHAVRANLAARIVSET